MVHTKSQGHRPGSGKGLFLKGFYHICAFWPSWSCDLYILANLSYGVFIGNLSSIGLTVSEKTMTLYIFCLI